MGSRLWRRRVERWERWGKLQGEAARECGLDRDDYEYVAPELVALLRARCARYLR